MNRFPVYMTNIPSRWKTESNKITMAQKYKVIKKDKTKITPEQLQELKIRVEVIPPSLALAQGAEESGWGTSRFALLGNSLFGQWDFSGKGIKIQPAE